jgi:hypothetical protein
MNILIAGIVLSIMLLLGGAKYYNHYRNEQHLYEERMSQDAAQRWVDEANKRDLILDNLDKTECGRYGIIRTEEHLNTLLKCSLTRFSYYRIATDLTEQRVREIVQSVFIEADTVSNVMQNLYRIWPIPSQT